MKLSIHETIHIIIAILILVLAGSCVYDATVHSKFTYALPTTQSNSNIRQQQPPIEHRESAHLNAP